MAGLPEKARVVVIGAGIVGTSMAWHLARRVRGAIPRMAQLCLLLATAGKAAVTQAGILRPDRHGMMH